MNANRYPSIDAGSLCVSPEWSMDHALPPSRLFGANGMRFDAADRLYVAQAFGSQISRVDAATGAVTTISPVGGHIVAPDDLAFDSQGTLYATEVFSERVSALTANGETRVIADRLPVANGITIHEDRIFVDEFRVGGRILELFRDGHAPRLIAQDLVLPNALSVGPDGFLYFPLVMTGEVGRVPIAGGAVETFVGGLNLPTAVKFDSRGRLVVVQSGNGEIRSYDIQTRAATMCARVRPGIDNLAFSSSGALYVSNFCDGGISRVDSDGSEAVLIPRGLVGPYGLAAGADGTVYIADGMSYATLSSAGAVDCPAMLLNHGFPGYVRGVAVGRDGALIFSNSAGGVARFAPGTDAQWIATDLDEVMGLAIGADGRAIVCEAGAGRLLSLNAGESPRVIATGLHRPTGLALGEDGSCYVSEAGAGRVVHVRNGSAAALLTGLIEPHGVSISGQHLFVVDRGSRKLHCVSLQSKQSRLVAAGLPVGPAPGIVPKLLPGIPGIMPGPLSPFADLATANDGSILLAADGEGSVLRFRASTQGGGV